MDEMNLLTVDDIRQRLRVGKNKAYDLMREMGVVTIGKKSIRVTEESYKKWLEERR